jgi:ectoine hydroxylase-related dioxygenase (phytanoyl-CoA dioxygenase family)
MYTRATAEQIENYRDAGYLVVNEFVTPEELAEVTLAVEAAVQQIGRQRVADNPELAESEGYRNNVSLQRLNLWKVNETIKRYFLNPEFGRMLCQLAGVAGIRIWHDQTFFKPPWGNPTAFHLDAPNWSFSSPDAIQIWVALDDATHQNGCLYYIPGSHKVTRYDKNASIHGDVGALFDVYPELREVEPHAVELGAGDAVLHNGLTVHGTGPNMSPHWRRAMSCQYMPDGATFNGNRCILPRERLALLVVGDRLDDETNNPLLWKAELDHSG